MNIEENNIQALLSLGANINQQDRQGNSPLHLTIISYIDDQDNYLVYKEIIKEILQYGASRTLKNNVQQRPVDVLRQLQDKVKLQTEQDYVENEESLDSNIAPENQF